MADIALRGIQKSYGPVSVIRNVDLQIADGEFCVFVGPSGCGKSTLLRMIAGLEDISGGDLFIGGRRANDTPPARPGQRLAITLPPQALHLFDGDGQALPRCIPDTDLALPVAA